MRAVWLLRRLGLLAYRLSRWGDLLGCLSDDEGSQLHVLGLVLRDIGFGMMTMCERILSSRTRGFWLLVWGRLWAGSWVLARFNLRV